MNKWLRKSESYVEYWAKFFVMIFGIALAIFTVISILPILPEDDQLRLLIFLILFMVAASIVFLFETRHLFRKQPIIKQEGTEIPEHLGHISRNRWISIGLLVLIVVVLGLAFLARQLPATPQGYQTFFMAFAAIGAWVTGIAIAVFAYQQYKLRQTEHRLLFEPQLVLTSGDIFASGSRVHDSVAVPYQINWTVFIQNTSQTPMLIDYMDIWAKLAADRLGWQGWQVYITSTRERVCHVAEPENLSMPFEVTITKPQRIKWTIEGLFGDAFDSLSRESNQRDFVLACRVSYKRYGDPADVLFDKEVVSDSINIPQDANWVSKTAFLDTALKDEKGHKTT